VEINVAERMSSVFITPGQLPSLLQVFKIPSLDHSYHLIKRFPPIRQIRIGKPQATFEIVLEDEILDKECYSRKNPVGL